MISEGGEHGEGAGEEAGVMGEGQGSGVMSYELGVSNKKSVFWSQRSGVRNGKSSVMRQTSVKGARSQGS